LLIQVHYYVAE